MGYIVGTDETNIRKTKVEEPYVDFEMKAYEVDIEGKELMV